MVLQKVDLVASDISSVFSTLHQDLDGMSLSQLSYLNEMIDLLNWKTVSTNTQSIIHLLSCLAFYQRRIGEEFMFV